MNSLEIPDKYAEYADAMRATMKKTVKIKLKPESNLKKWQSKVGGEPYLPITQQYPLNSEGEPMLFLAQVNFSELPQIQGFPVGGIVEFYINGQDDLMGLDDDGFEVLYFSDVDTDESNLRVSSEKVNFPCGPLETDVSHSMEFCLENQYISVNDYRFDNIVKFGDNYDMYDEYNDHYPSNGHRIGGYPYFTQTDPRSDSNHLKDHELLFQLDSDNNILWGDMGVGAFFIKPDDLKKLDFTDVLYNWDCC